MNPGALPTLGRFQLLEPIAEGGMASVWRAVHREQGVHAAVKVLTGRFSRDQAEGLRAEVRAMALLDHPRIVTVFDQGAVDARAAALSGRVLREGSPWLALELVEGGTLAGLYKGLNWRTLQSVLSQLLQALGHAHSHGVVHRDLKLANVLVDEGGRGIKLTDFGISYAVQKHEDGEADLTMNAGTPRYMAPEQMFGRIHEQGPWTDLYSLGVLAWRLATGVTPFPDEWEASAVAKTLGNFGPFIPRFSVPAGFPGWCARLMRPHPIHRFRAAADALFALQHVGPEPLEDPATGPTSLASQPDLQSQALPIEEPVAQAAPLPRRWAADVLRKRPRELVGCGLELFGLRRGRMIGRVGLRDRMWRALSAVHATHKSRVVVLRGPSGYGKSSLASWLTRRAEEVGGGVALRTSWTQEQFSGLPGLIARKLRCLTADSEVVRERIHQHLRRTRGPDADEARGLLQLLDPAESRRRGEFDEVARDARFALVTRAIARLSPDRPAVVHFDDAHASPEAFSFPHAVLDDPGTSPALFVLTVQEEALAESHAAREAMDALLTHPQVEVIEVGALPLEHQVDFVRGLLPLEPALASRVARRTEGNPLFASQLLDDWVARDLLELSVDGFRLRNALDASLPSTLTEVWRVRVESLLEATEPHFRVPLEIAACLGSAVSIPEWKNICDQAGWAAPDALIEALLTRRLATLDGDDQWRFVHGMLREAILKSTAVSGRLRTHHRAIAESLAATGGAAVRVGRHLLQAHAGREAIDPLEDGAEEAVANGDYNEALQLLRARSALMQQVRAPASDPRWGRGWVAQAELLARLERWDEAERFARLAANEGAEHDWPKVEVEALMLLVENRAATDLEAAREILERAYQVAVQPGNEETLAPVCLLASQVARRSGDLQQALVSGRHALTHLLAHGGLRRARCEIELAQTLIKLRKLDSAMRHVRRAEQLTSRNGSRFDTAVCAYLRAKIHREQGSLQNAALSFQDATDRFSVLGDANAWAMRAHLGLCLAEQGKIARANGLFRTVLDSNSKVGDLLAHVGCMFTTADDVDLRIFATHYGAVRQFVRRGWCDPLVTKFVDLAASRASRSGFEKRARLLNRLSQHQRRRLVSASA